MNDYRQAESSEEIKAEIAQTRAQMESKINRIQDKLDPDRLKEQAQDTVRTMVADGRSAAMSYLREHKEEISSSMLDAVKQNPIPAALIGIGLGWLALESMSPKRDRYDYERNRYLPVRREDALRYEGNYGYSSGYSGPSYRGDERWDAYGRTPTYGEWQGSSSPDRQRYAARGMEDPYRPEFSQREEDGRNWAQQAKDQVTSQAKDVAESVKDAAQSVSDKAGEAVGAVRDAVGQAGERMRSSADEMVDRVRGRTEHMSDEARWRAGQFGQQMDGRGEALGMQARQVGRQVGQQIEENPLMIGAMAFAVGAAVAMLMPQSRMENRYVGEARDRVMDSAKELGQEVTERAQQVVQEVRPEVEQTAKKLVEEVKQTGKEAVQELQGTAQKVQQKAKQEGEALKSSVENSLENKVNSPAGTGTMPENWTTLKGRWNQMKGEAKRQWGKLTDDDLTRIEGDYEKLVGMIQQKYGYSRSQAEQEVGAFSRSRV